MIPWLYIQTYCQPCYHPRLNATWQDEFASAGRWIIAHKVGSPTTSDNSCKCVDNSIVVQCSVQYPVDIHTRKFTVRTTKASGFNCWCSILLMTGVNMAVEDVLVQFDLILLTLNAPMSMVACGLWGPTEMVVAVVVVDLPSFGMPELRSFVHGNSYEKNVRPDISSKIF